MITTSVLLKSPLIKMGGKQQMETQQLKQAELDDSFELTCTALPKQT